MSRMLLNYRGVPDAEIDGVRAALDDAGIEYYELPPSAFLISAGSLWIRHREDFARASEVHAEFQRDYTRRARRAPPPPGMVEQLRREPLRILGVLVAAIAVLLLFAWPVLHLVGIAR